MLVSEETCIPINRIKLIGVFGAAGTSDNDVIMLNQFEKKIKKNDTFVITVMGTPDAELAAFEQGGEKTATDAVLNDFNHNFTPASKEWHNLKRFTDSLEINFIQEPRPGKKLLVLDLDHTILDFSSRDNVSPAQMKRPFMDCFLETMYESYDIGIWSQTVRCSLSVCLIISVCVFNYLCVCVCVCLCLCLCVYVCLVYVYVCMYMYVCLLSVISTSHTSPPLLPLLPLLALEVGGDQTHRAGHHQQPEVPPVLHAGQEQHVPQRCQERVHQAVTHHLV
jgi:hypothetical protein